MVTIKEIAQIFPSERQKKWQEIEFYAFIHFGMNTFMDREWGRGDEDPRIFNPEDFHADQWVEVCKSGGMKGLILTCKHHDGFCLWPSEYTDHSVKSSPWKSGKGDIVKEVSEACRRGGIQFGIYLSPWDRHEKTYGESERYNQYFKNQLKELLTNYGEVFCVWFDGACGEGTNGKKQIYDWEGYYQIIRNLQPNAVISVCGPDVRWCGNEAGHCRTSEWSVVPAYLQNVEKIQDKSQKVDDGTFSKQINSQDEDLGSRSIVQNAERLVWYPAEVNTSIRPGWFYHSSEDDKVRSLSELLSIYYQSVGGNASFLLNIPPTKQGLIHEKDAKRIEELGTVIANTFSEDFAKDAFAHASETMDAHHSVKNIFNEDKNTYWCPKEGTEKIEIEMDLQRDREFDRIVIMEHIASGQRIEEFVLEYRQGGTWKKFYEGTVVGYKRICCFDNIRAQYIRLRITQSRWYPTISKIGVYKSEFCQKS